MIEACNLDHTDVIVLAPHPSRLQAWRCVRRLRDSFALREFRAIRVERDDRSRLIHGKEISDLP